MESNIEKIVAEFATNIFDNIISIKKNLKTVKDKIQVLRDIYSDLIEQNNHKQIFLFCLESFNFQNKTLLYESEHLNKTFSILLNRTYRDYYKLYNIILKIFDEYKLENKTQKKHPEYRDLDINTDFTLEQITNIHDDVIYLTCVLIDKYKEGVILINKYKAQSKTGIYIINLINTIEYDNAILKDQIDLYINYLFFFQDTQNTYFSKLYNKLSGFLNEIEKDINLQNGNVEDDDFGVSGEELNVSEATNVVTVKSEASKAINRVPVSEASKAINIVPVSEATVKSEVTASEATNIVTANEATNTMTANIVTANEATVKSEVTSNEAINTVTVSEVTANEVTNIVTASEATVKSEATVSEATVSEATVSEVTASEVTANEATNIVTESEATIEESTSTNENIGIEINEQPKPIVQKPPVRRTGKRGMFG
jgi:hypothetical protein